MVDNKKFRFEADWAQPLVTGSLTRISNAGLLPTGSTASRINLIGNHNYLFVNGDSVEAYLPYYGEQQMSGGYNSSDNGIQFKGLAQHMEISGNDKHTGYRIDFTIKEGTESFQVKMELYSNMRSMVSINSSHRHLIRYDGKFMGLDGKITDQFE